VVVIFVIIIKLVKLSKLEQFIKQQLIFFAFVFEFVIEQLDKFLQFFFKLIVKF
jgi:hypothetical protein